MRFNGNRWTKAVSDWVPRDMKRTIGRPPTRCSDFFTKSFKENYDALCVPRERRNHWATLARDRRPVRRSTGVKVIKVIKVILERLHSANSENEISVIKRSIEMVTEGVRRISCEERRFGVRKEDHGQGERGGEWNYGTGFTR
ncbi:hypothetical protein RB195_025064 [Necator americanus]|uniref:Uncharacterized protein n=1 Tax=Necator americanus TaxID=51031 RepID=A0ABR1EQR7_NECAM